MEWLYPFSKYAIDRGMNVKINGYIVKFYEAAYKNQPKAKITNPIVIPKQPEINLSKNKLRVPAKYLYLTLMTVKDLNNLCSQRGLTCKGNKNDIIQTILNDYTKNE
jgi:hypothetical protein